MVDFYEQDKITPQHLVDDNLNTIVIDIGSETVRAGFPMLFNKEPQIDIPSYVGVLQQDEKSKFYIGNENLRPKEGMQLKPLMYDTHVDNFDLLEKIIEYIIEKLQFDAKKYMFLFSECVFQTEKERIKLAELMFEKFGARAIYTKPSASLQLASAGLTSGLVIDSGASHTSVTPVIDLYALRSVSRKADIGGNLIVDEVLEFFEREKIDVVPNYLVHDKKVSLPDTESYWKAKTDVPNVSSTYLNWSTREIAKDFAANMFTVSPKPIDSKDYHEKRLYSFPNGLIKTYDHQRYQIPECLFDTSYMSYAAEIMPIQEMVFSVFEDVDPSLKSVFEKNMLITGGNSCLPGFDARLEYEIHERLPLIQLKSSKTSTRRFDAYTGGAILATNPRFIWSWISSQEYKEDGNRRLHEL